MFSLKCKAFLLHVDLDRVFYLKLTIFKVTDCAIFLYLRKRTQMTLDTIFLQFLAYYRIILPIDKRIILRLILKDTHLGINVVLHLKVISVKMIRCNIQQNRNVGSEVIHIVQLERAELNDIVSMWIFCNLEGK